jgi:predicted RNA methylase
MSGIFNPDFYPTPPEVASLMLDPLDLRGKTILEPSAGKGDLAKECIARGAHEVLWCETETELCRIIHGGKGLHQLCGDFLSVTADQVSHIDMIVMNPPFSADERHILHAWEIAPAGCEIVALCNWNTISGWRAPTTAVKSGPRLQQQLSHLIDAYGSKWEHKTGLCCRCGGSGQTVQSISVQNGTTYRQCIGCEGAGTALHVRAEVKP